MSKERYLEEVQKWDKRNPGVRHLKRYLKGETLTLKEAMLAMCSDCMGLHIDGKHDCEIEECPLYPWMPYRKKK